jgi:hypothetical protein
MVILRATSILGGQKGDTRVIRSITSAQVLDCDQIGGVGELIKNVTNMSKVGSS